MIFIHQKKQNYIDLYFFKGRISRNLDFFCTWRSVMIWEPHIATKIGMDMLSNIPDMFLDSGTHTVTRRHDRSTP